VANQSSGPSGPGNGSRRGRRAPTIDLSAEEVKRTGEAEAAEDAGDDAARPSETEPAGERQPGSDEPAAKETQPQHSERQEAKPEPIMPSAFATGAAARGGASGARPARGRGAVAAGLLLAALAGGLVVLAGLVVLGRAGILPIADGREETAALRGQIASLEDELSAARQAAELEGEDLQAQIADLNQRVAALTEAAPAEPAAPQADPAQAEEMAELRAGLEELRDELGAASAAAALEEVGERLEQLEGLPERVEALAGRVQALQAAPGEGVAEAVETEIAGLADRLAEIESAVSQLGQRMEGAASAEALETVRAELTAQLQDTGAQLETARGDADARLSDLSQQIVLAQAAVAAQALADAVAAGRPFPAELQAVRAVGIEEAELAQLAPHAETGLPSRTELRRQFSGIAEGIRQAEAPAPSDAGPLERLMHSARNIVEVRPAGPQPGESAGAVASRIEAALAAGDLARALEEWQDLPEDARAASQDWAEEARAVLAGETLARRLRSEALARLAAGD
jgi:hypothetical protein